MNFPSRSPSSSSKTRTRKAETSQGVSFLLDMLRSRVAGVEPASPQAESPLFSRRKAVMSLFSLALATFTSGCDDDNEELIYQHFKVKEYPRLANEPKRAETPLEDAQLMGLLKQIIVTELGSCPDFSQLFDLRFDGQNIHADLPISAFNNPEIATNTLQQQGFEKGSITLYEDRSGFLLNCDKGGLHLSLDVNSKGIQVEVYERACQSNTVGVKIAASGGDPGATPTALTIDIARTTTDASDTVKARQVIAGDGSQAFSDEASGYFQFQQAGSQPFVVSDTKSFLQFLKVCQCTEMIKQILAVNDPFHDPSKNRTPFFEDVDSNDTIGEILELLPKKDLDLWSRFLNLAVRYKSNRIEELEYLDPKSTLQSGFGNCSDYAVINAFWSYLHGYAPDFLVINLPDDAQGNAQAHVFVWYENEEKRIVVLDNDGSTVLKEGQTLKDYIRKNWPGGEKILDEEA